ncbi:hypothetical protein NF681_01620 (plasmid) [Comamonadaceae bacterium OTU4NAUVB1]|nr:hypothetical protein NF681_01620 [Comamonadaceae bacterium OTU4NAUVB1]
MKIALCTLFESHYHYGVAALVNSLAASGYEGSIWVGHRGDLPAWIVDHPGFDPHVGRLQVTPALALNAVRLDPTFSLNYYKPVFMQAILSTHEPACDAVAYLDPDVIVKCAWREIQAWFEEDGVVLVEDINGSLPSNHRKRLLWRLYFAGQGETQRRSLERYYNSGFVGVRRSHLQCLRAWQRICERIVAEVGTARRQRKAGGPDDLFHSTDEDALNFALTLSDVRLNACGPEAMDFAPGGRHLSHAIGADKPWQGRHLRRALRGQPPSIASRWFYRFAEGPLAPFSALRLARRRGSLALAIALGRLYQRLRTA